MSSARAVAVAHSNIALAKYWGKADVTQNLPAVPSLSLTLDAMRTVTSVELDPALDRDKAVLDGQELAGRPLTRVVELLDGVRALAGAKTRASVASRNDFPTAAGLASSASGFAALALAATRAFGLSFALEEVSALARAASASAARSVFGGYAALRAGAKTAERVAPAEHWPLVMLVCVTAAGPKSIGSTEGMQHTMKTSPYFSAWVAHSNALFEEARGAVLARDLETLGAAMEQSALMMHASMLAARPAVVYFTPATLAVMERVRALRAAGNPAFYTMDAGPHVKVLTPSAAADAVEQALAQVAGVQRIIRCRPGPDAHLLDADFELEQAVIPTERSSVG